MEPKPADQFKSQGNDAFKAGMYLLEKKAALRSAELAVQNSSPIAGDYATAVSFYSKAIDANPQASYLTNRAAAYMGLSEFASELYACFVS